MKKAPHSSQKKDISPKTENDGFPILEDPPLEIITQLAPSASVSAASLRRWLPTAQKTTVLVQLRQNRYPAQQDAKTKAIILHKLAPSFPFLERVTTGKLILSYELVLIPQVAPGKKEDPDEFPVLEDPPPEIITTLTPAAPVPVDSLQRWFATAQKTTLYVRFLGKKHVAPLDVETKAEVLYAIAPIVPFLGSITEGENILSYELVLIPKVAPGSAKRKK
jgi:hypothetical protein